MTFPTTPAETLKCAVVGDSGVGKFVLFTRLTNPTTPFTKTQQSTAAVEFFAKFVQTDHHSPLKKLQIWKTRDQKDYQHVLNQCYQNTRLVFLVYDISNKASYDHIPSWKATVDAQNINRLEQIAYVLIGNKADLSTARQVSQEEAQAFASKNNFLHFEISAKTGTHEDFDPILKAATQAASDKIPYEQQLHQEIQQIRQQYKSWGRCFRAAVGNLLTLGGLLTLGHGGGFSAERKALLRQLEARANQIIQHQKLEADKKIKILFGLLVQTSADAAQAHKKSSIPCLTTHSRLSCLIEKQLNNKTKFQTLGRNACKQAYDTYKGEFSAPLDHQLHFYLSLFHLPRQTNSKSYQLLTKVWHHLRP